MPEEIEIIFDSKAISKKNGYTPNRNGNGFFKSSKLQAELDALGIQIPGYLRDLRLENPDIEIFETVVKLTGDKDGSLTTILDLLVDYGILIDDNRKHCGGKITLHETQKGKVDQTRVIIRPRQASSSK